MLARGYRMVLAPREISALLVILDAAHIPYTAGKRKLVIRDEETIACMLGELGGGGET